MFFFFNFFPSIPQLFLKLPFRRSLTLQGSFFTLSSHFTAWSQYTPRFTHIPITQNVMPLPDWWDILMLKVSNYLSEIQLDWWHSIFITQSGNPTQITLCAFRPACHCHMTLSLRLCSTSPLALANLVFKNHPKCPFLCKAFLIFLRQFRSSCNIFTTDYQRPATVNWLLIFLADHELSKGPAGPGYLCIFRLGM